MVHNVPLKAATSQELLLTLWYLWDRRFRLSAGVSRPGKLTDDEKRSSVPLNGKSKKVKPIRDVHDALTLAGRILYKAMYGPPEGTDARHCAKGYRQLARETHLDKDTVRDLIAEFKDKGIVREIATYDPDTRSSKTYEVQSSQAILDLWREAGLFFVTSGRQRPEFCTAQGQPQPLGGETLAARPPALQRSGEHLFPV
jgi:hypothetical protein